MTSWSGETQTAMMATEVEHNLMPVVFSTSLTEGQKPMVLPPIQRITILHVASMGISF